MDAIFALLVGLFTAAAIYLILSRALIHDFPEDYAISAVKEFEWNGIKQHNRNLLLWRDNTVDGIKTGHTAAAGYCLAASAKQGDARYGALGVLALAVMIGGLLTSGPVQRSPLDLSHGRVVLFVVELLVVEVEVFERGRGG